jgi:hypothetical protein
VNYQVPPELSVIDTLLVTAFRNRIREPNIEAGFETFRSVADQPLTYEAFTIAMTCCLRRGLIREPIRLPEGALQCHWQLELTPTGVTAARAILARSQSD